jgi:HD-like signal output (HDOD) protein/ActR/RegA family two-component response regulator
MITLMLVSQNERETQILKMAFEQRGLKVLLSKAEYQNYIKTLQFMPDIILMEMPRPHMQQLHFASLIKSHKKGKRIPIIGYGDAVDPVEKNGILQMGFSVYLERPIKFSQLIKLIENFLKQSNKKLDAKDQVVQDKDRDIELLLATDTLPLKKIEIMTSYVAQLLAFPFTVAKVLNLAESLKSAASDLAKVIEADPVLSTQILKLSNSVLFASINRRIASMKDAIVRIGFRETKRLVMSMSVMKLFKEENMSAGFDRTGFWYHSLATGIIAERLARRLGTVNSEEVFLSGLLHDFGIIVLDEFFPTILFRVLEDTSNRGALFIDRETAILGVHHNDVVKELFAKWKLPELVSEGVIKQYEVDLFKDAIDSPGKKYATCVAMGNILAKAMMLGKECDMYVSPIDNALFAFAKMQTGFTKSFLDDVHAEMNLYREFLKLDSPQAASTDAVQTGEKKRLGVVNLTNNVFVPPIHYLGKEGHAVNPILATTPLAKYDCAFDALLVWAGAETTADDLAKYQHVVKYSETPPEAGKPPVFAPVLALVPREAANLAQNEKCTGMSFTYTSMDLRQLDKYLTSMSMGKTVLLSETEPPLPPGHRASRVAEPLPVPNTIEAKPTVPDPAPASGKPNPKAPLGKKDDAPSSASNPDDPVSAVEDIDVVDDKPEAAAQPVSSVPQQP